MRVGRFVLAAILIAALAQSASARPAQRQYLSEIDGDAPVSRRQLAMMAASTAVSEPSRSALAIRPSKIASIYGRCRAVVSLAMARTRLCYGIAIAGQAAAYWC